MVKMSNRFFIIETVLGRLDILIANKHFVRKYRREIGDAYYELARTFTALQYSIYFVVTILCMFFKVRLNCRTKKLNA